LFILSPCASILSLGFVVFSLTLSHSCSRFLPCRLYHGAGAWCQHPFSRVMLPVSCPRHAALALTFGDGSAECRRALKGGTLPKIYKLAHLDYRETGTRGRPRTGPRLPIPVGHGVSPRTTRAWDSSPTGTTVGSPVGVPAHLLWEYLSTVGGWGRVVEATNTVTRLNLWGGLVAGASLVEHRFCRAN
jgi:hypothetical protein